MSLGKYIMTLGLWWEDPEFLFSLATDEPLNSLCPLGLLLRDLTKDLTKTYE